MKFPKSEIISHTYSPATILKSRSIMAIVLIVASLIAGQLITFQLTQRNLGTSRTINIAGRQRMLSQKLSKTALLLKTATTENDLAQPLDELNRAADLFELSHNGLLHGNTHLGLNKETDPQALLLFSEIESSYNSLLTAAKKLPDAVKKDDKVLIETLTAIILESEKPFLKGMDAIVFHLDESSQTQIKSLERVSMLLFVLDLIVLFIGYIFIIRPAITFMDKAFSGLEELGMLKDEFVSLASHELRTPMTSIAGFVDMMREGRYGLVTKELQEPLGYIAESTDRLIRMVNDLLNVSRIESGRMKFTFEQVDLGKTVVKVVAGLLPFAKQRKLELTNDTKQDVVTQADSEKIEEILNNLIGNSLKFTDKGKVTVTVKLDGDMGVVEVADTGIGIPTEGRDKLFGKFQQISTDAAARPNGTGLGLYLSRQMAQRMGGDILLIDSTLHIGSKFALKLPIANSSIAKKIKKELEEKFDANPDQKDPAQIE